MPKPRTPRLPRACLVLSPRRVDPAAEAQAQIRLVPHPRRRRLLKRLFRVVDSRS